MSGKRRKKSNVQNNTRKGGKKGNRNFQKKCKTKTHQIPTGMIGKKKGARDDRGTRNKPCRGNCKKGVRARLGSLGWVGGGKTEGGGAGGGGRYMLSGGVW